jgi:hypothetical protein
VKEADGNATVLLRVVITSVAPPRISELENETAKRHAPTKGAGAENL